MGARDPVQDSYDELIEGLRLLNEHVDIETFVSEFLQMKSIKSAHDAAKEMCHRYNVRDRYIKRARTFIMSCFDDDE